ncbi:MAG: hypothetical protein EXS44_00915 [Candidatus Levybacteria bacterium]|nr:hypothetical protein [Candidatus Levybacteria bacterium]
MKLQDILFFIIFFVLFIKNNSKLTTITGLTCLVISMPLFFFWIFFTAERLTWYAGAFFFLSISQLIFSEIRSNLK